MTLILSFASATLSASTNSAWFTRVWQTDDGLPNNHVSAIVQDQDGYLWVATGAGLARFDGIRFTPVSYRDLNEGQSQKVRMIVPSRTGGLWILSERGPVIGLDSDLSH